MQRNMRDHPTLHSDTNQSKGTALLLLFYSPTIMRTTRTIK